MEYHSLGDLRHYMQERPKMWLDESFFSWVGRQTLLDLNWLHEHRILHGDLEPPNILAFPLRHSPHIKIGDLGSCVDISPLGGDDMARIHPCIATHEYVAAEMLMAGIPVEKPTNRSLWA